jgi:hypothetical protein
MQIQLFQSYRASLSHLPQAFVRRFYLSKSLLRMRGNLFEHFPRLSPRAAALSTKNLFIHLRCERAVSPHCEAQMACSGLGGQGMLRSVRGYEYQQSVAARLTSNRLLNPTMHGRPTVVARHAFCSGAATPLEPSRESRTTGHDKPDKRHCRS